MIYLVEWEYFTDDAASVNLPTFEHSCETWDVTIHMSAAELRAQDAPRAQGVLQRGWPDPCWLIQVE